MLIDILKYGLQPSGVIHVGAHYGQEYKQYRKMGIPDSKIIFIEAHPETFKELQSRLGHTDCQLHNVACGSTFGKMHMHTSKQNQGQSNSLLEPVLHKVQHPDIVFTDTVEVNVMPLDFIAGPGYDLLVMDCQGYELEVLKGAAMTIASVNWIYTEVNKAEVYRNCALVEEIDEYLSMFEREETSWIGNWGDAFYKRKQ